MKSTNLILLLISFSFVILLTSCGRSPWSKYVKENQIQFENDKSAGLCSTDLHSTVVWVKGPYVASVPQAKDESEFTLIFDQDLDPQLVPQVEIWMPDMNHGSVPVKVSGSINHFNVRNVYFTMYGLWEIRIKFEGALTCVHEINLEPR